jgi:hypothetical protein
MLIYFWDRLLGTSALENEEICHGVAIVEDDCNNNDNNKSHNEKAIEGTNSMTKETDPYR